MERRLSEWQITSRAESRPVQGPHSAGIAGESSDGLTLLLQIGSTIGSSDASTKGSWAENIRLFVQGGTLCYETSGTRTHSAQFQCLWTEVRFLQGWCFMVLFCWPAVTPEVWGVPKDGNRFGGLLKLWESRQWEMWPRTQRPPWLSSRGPVRRWWKIPEGQTSLRYSTNLSFKDWRLKLLQRCFSWV